MGIWTTALQILTTRPKNIILISIHNKPCGSKYPDINVNPDLPGRRSELRRKASASSAYPTGLYNKMQQKYIIFIIISKFFQTGSEKRRPFLVKCVYSLLVLWSVPSLTFLLSSPLDSENFNLTNSKFQTKVSASETTKTETTITKSSVLRAEARGR